MHRIGIIPFDIRGDAVAVMFVTSQTRGRWILPKGQRNDGEDHKSTATREAMEEGGVQGVFVEDYPLTTVITKQSDEGKQQIAVTYYPLLVTEQFDEWPEKSIRERHWIELHNAMSRNLEPEFVNIIKNFILLKDFIMSHAKEKDLLS